MTQPHNPVRHAAPSPHALLLVAGMTVASTLGVPALYIYFHHNKISAQMERFDNAIHVQPEKIKPQPK
jgi:hypothetical protein